MSFCLVWIFLGNIFSLLAFFPYIFGIVKKQVKPRIASWLVWGVLTAINSAAAFSDGQILTGFLALIISIGCFSVMALGWKYGNRKFHKLDIICLIVSGFGIILWLLLDSPILAICVAISADFVAGIPTLEHSYHKPKEECLYTFLFAFLGAVFILMAQPKMQFTALAYPIYLVLINGAYVAIISRGKYYKKLKKIILTNIVK